MKEETESRDVHWSVQELHGYLTDITWTRSTRIHKEQNHSC